MYMRECIYVSVNVFVSMNLSVSVCVCVRVTDPSNSSTLSRGQADILEHRQEQIKAEEVKLRSMQAQVMQVIEAGGMSERVGQILNYASYIWRYPIIIPYVYNLHVVLADSVIICMGLGVCRTSIFGSLAFGSSHF